MAYQPQGTGYPQLLPESGIFCDHATAKYSLGMLAIDIYGNEYRYVRANEAIAVGELVTAVALAAWDSGIVTDGAVVAGDTKIHVDTITTAKAANFYAGYWIRQGEAAGKGRLHRIESHDAMAASGEVDLILSKSTPALEAIADGVALQIFNPYNMELTDAATEVIRGVGIGTITSGQYGFVQVGGLHPGVLCDGSNGNPTVVNEPIVPYASDPGQGQGRDGSAEADIVEMGLSPLVALDASTTDAGYVPAQFVRRV